MPFSVIQAGTSLQLMDTDGGLTTLTLPSGVTLRSDIPPRWASYREFVILTNTPSRPLTIDASGTVRPLTPLAPVTAPVLSGSTSGTLSGTYQARETYVVFDGNGKLIAESDFSPTSNTVSISSKLLTAASLATSGDTISGRRLYRTTTGTSVYFIWIDLDGNVVTTISDDLSDAGLSTFSAPGLGTPPHLTLIAEFRDRLFGVGDVERDSLRYTEVAAPWAWPGDNTFPVPHVGADTIGITSLLNRRDALGVGKLNRFLQFTGTSDSDFRLITLSENCGVLSQESVGIFQDVAYFLWHDGVYRWDPNTLTCVSDGKVRSWFTTGDFFDRERFGQAFGKVDPVRGKYRLYLINPDGDWEWVEYDLVTRNWWGPHSTEAFTPTSTFTLYSAGNRPGLASGASDGGVYIDQTPDIDTPVSGSPRGITFDLDTPPFYATDPDYENVWGELSIMGKAQDVAEAGTLTVTPRVGDLGVTPSTPASYDMSLSRQRLGRMGQGKLLSLNLHHEKDADEPVELYGFEIPQVIQVGRR